MLKAQIRRLVGKPVRALRRLWVDPTRASCDIGACDNTASQYTVNPLFSSIMRDYPHQYVWPSVQAAKLGKQLAYDRVSFIEFGVAGGNSLLVLEAVAKRLEDHFKIDIEVYGFDTSAGLPWPHDYRDLPNLWSEGFFRMDVEKLRTRLTKARLMLGLVEETVPPFLTGKAAPVAFVSFDVDYYSSTVAALKLLEAEQQLLLPRVHCYFDDIMGYTFCEFTGERLAINEFNAAHSLRKLAPIPGLRYYVPPRFANWMWEKYYLFHIFDHALYGASDGNMQAHYCGLPPG